MKNHNLPAYLLQVALGERRGFRATLVRLLLGFLEFIYFLLIKLNYRCHKEKALPVPVISIGNITAGGTGKTPAAVWLANYLQGLDLNPAILTRGYGGESQQKGIIFNSNDLADLTARTTGDEPYLLAHLLPQMQIAVGRDRYQMGLEALKMNPQIDVFILDDGFQYWRLKRDLDLIIIDASKPFSNGRLIPRGLLREPLSSLKRAGLILLTRTTKLAQEDLNLLIRDLKTKTESIPVAIALEENRWLFSLPDWLSSGSGISAPEFLAGRKVSAITAIGNPRQFLGSLESMGAEVGYFKAYPDHYQWEKAELVDLVQGLQEFGFTDLIVTAKDGVKLTSFASVFQRIGLNCLVLSLEFSVSEPAVLDKIRAVTRKKGRDK